MRTIIQDTFTLSIDREKRGMLALLAVMAAAACAEMVPAELSGVLHGETGAFELGSVGLLGAASLIGLGGALHRASRARWSAALVLLALLLRELDFQKRFTYRSIESVGFYTRPIASLQEKLLAAAVLATCAVAAFVLARAAWRAYRSGAVRVGDWARPVVLAVVFVGSALVSEKLLHRVVAEEVFESAFAACILTLAWRLRPEGRARGLDRAGGMAEVPSTKSLAASTRARDDDEERFAA